MLEKHPDLFVEGLDHSLVFYRRGKVLTAEDVAQFQGRRAPDRGAVSRRVSGALSHPRRSPHRLGGTCRRWITRRAPIRRLRCAGLMRGRTPATPRRIGYLYLATAGVCDRVGENLAEGARYTMKNSMTAVAGVVGVTVLVGLSVSGCHSETKQSGSGTTSSSASSSASSSVSAQPADYTALLIKDSDIKAPEVFTASPTAEPQWQARRSDVVQQCGQHPRDR